MYSALLSLIVLASGMATPAAAQEEPGIKLFGEVNLNYRNSAYEEFRLQVPFPPEFWEPGDDAVFLRTVDPGSHYELSDVEIGLDVTFSVSSFEPA